MNKQKWYRKAQTDNWKAVFKVKVEKIIFYSSDDEYIIFSGEVIKHQSEYLKRNFNLRPVLKGYVSGLIKEGELIECTGRGRLGNKSGKYEINFINLKQSVPDEVLVEVIEMLRRPTGAVEASNGAIRYYVRHGDYNATYSQSIRYEGIVRSLLNVKKSRLFSNQKSFTLKELTMNDKNKSPILLAKKYWEYRPVEDVLGNEKYEIIEGSNAYRLFEKKY